MNSKKDNVLGVIKELADVRSSLDGLEDIVVNSFEIYDEDVEKSFREVREHLNSLREKIELVCGSNEVSDEEFCSFYIASSDSNIEKGGAR